MAASDPKEILAARQDVFLGKHNTLKDLIAETRQYLAPRDLERIEHAYELANRAHMGTVRVSGEPYIQHPLEVALLLADMRIDADGIASASPRITRMASRTPSMLSAAAWSHTWEKTDRFTSSTVTARTWAPI